MRRHVPEVRKAVVATLMAQAIDDENALLAAVRRELRAYQRPARPFHLEHAISAIGSSKTTCARRFDLEDRSPSLGGGTEARKRVAAMPSVAATTSQLAA